jgi:AraC family transcriptional regulator, positive regulator of tynA and feaB
MIAPLRCPIQVGTNGRGAATVTPGELYVIDHAVPHEIMHGDGVRALCVDIPRRLVAASAISTERLTGRVIRADNAGARLLVAMLHAMGSEFRPGLAVNFAPETASGLWSLILATFSALGDPRSGRDPACRLRSVYADIDANLWDAGLRPSDIAARCGFSERYLRTLLHSTGETFSNYLLRRRLERCAQFLRDPTWHARTITEIAFNSGFSNATHFGRAFKARYGMTPREFRRRSA